MGEIPTPSEAVRIRTVTPKEQKFRGNLADALNHWPILPSDLNILEQADPAGNTVSSIAEAERLHAEEGRGIIYAYNHFDRTDPLIALFIPYTASKILAGMPTLSPIEQKQYEQNQRLLTFLVDKTGDSLKPIVTEDTIAQYGVLREGEEKRVFPSKTGVDMKENDGFMEYITSAKDALLHGESVLLPIAAGRRPNLYTGSTLKEAKSRDLGPLGALNMRIGGKAENVEKVAVAFIGIGLNGVTDYKDARGFNFGRRTTVNFGPVVTLEALRGLAATFDTTLDEAGRAFLAEAVPDAYRNPSATR